MIDNSDSFAQYGTVLFCVLIIIITISLFRTKVQQHNYVIRTAKQCACAYLCVSILVT